jgi:multiple sugar transport system permease protein/putative aldouronate transport system permease protein
MVGEKGIASTVFDSINLLIMIALMLLCFLPLWYVLMLSLSDKAAVAGGLVGLLPVGFNFNSYREIMKDPKFFGSFYISIQRVLIGGSAAVICTVLMAFPLSKPVKDFPQRNIFMWILIFCMLFSGGLIPWYITVKNLGMLDTIWALSFSGGLGVFNVILMVNFFRNLPKELEEAALVDGAGPWYILYKLFVPMSKPVIATVSLFTAVGHWNDFFQGLVLMSRPERFPLQTYIQQLVVKLDTSTMTTEQLITYSLLSNRSLNAAKIFIAMIPILLIYPFLQRYFVTGITLGSVKE